MSASEKLRALEVHLSGVSLASDPIYARNVLRGALPLIADCIEQLEREHPEPHNYIEFETDNTDCPACAALTALREHLEGGDG